MSEDYNNRHFIIYTSVFLNLASYLTRNVQTGYSLEYSFFIQGKTLNISPAVANTKYSTKCVFIHL